MQVTKSFDLNSIQAQKSLRYEGISQLKVSVTAAKELHKDNGLDELYFRVGGKDYVAFGQGMNNEALNSPIPATFKGERVEIVDFSDEANTAVEGTKEIFSSIGGRLATGLGIAGGGMLGTHMVNQINEVGRFAHQLKVDKALSPILVPRYKPMIGELGKFKVAATHALVLGGIAAIGTAAVGAYQGATATADYQSIHQSTVGKTINPSAK